MERFAEIVNGCSILDVWQGSEYAYWILWNAIPEWNLNWQMTILTSNSFKKVSLFSSLRLILPGNDVVFIFSSIYMVSQQKEHNIKIYAYGFQSSGFEDYVRSC